MIMRGFIFSIVILSLIIVKDINSNIIDKTPKKTTDKQSNLKWSDMISVSVDDMTGDTTYKNKVDIEVMNEGKDEGFNIRFEKYGLDGSPWIMFETYGSGDCIENNNRIIILFSDKSKIDTKGSSKFNCKNVSLLKVDSEDYETLKSKNIDKVRVYTVNGSVERTFNKKQSDSFRNTIKHLIDLE